MSTRKEFALDLVNFIFTIRDEYPLALIEDIIELSERANKCHYYAEIDCNYGLSEKQEKADNKNDLAAIAIVNKWNMTLSINGDPRGAVYKVMLPSGKSNSFGGIGYCVPFWRR